MLCGNAGVLTEMLRRYALLLFTSFFISVNSAVSAENFTIRGLQLGMNMDQFRAIFESLGYKCKMVDSAYFDCTGTEAKLNAN